jgi:EmrB/QacA subfamily drug resistance transporter
MTTKTDTTEGLPPAGLAAPGEAAPGEAAPGKAAPEEAAPEEAAPGSVAPEGLAAGGLAPREPLPRDAPTGDAAAGGDASGYRWRWAVLAVVLAAEIMDLLDATVTAVAAPAMRADLGGSESAMQWLGAAYTLPFAVFLVTGGRLGDRYGRRRLFVIGAAGFTVASVAAALAPGIAALVAARAAQGALGALLIPQGFGLVKESFDERELPRAFAAFGPVMGLAAVGGPILAGWLVDADVAGTGWRMIFLINLPIGVATVLAALRFLPRSRPSATARLDAASVALVSVAAFALVFPLVQGRELGWPAWLLGLAAAGVAAGAAFAARQRRVPDRALVEPSLLRNRQYLGGMAVAVAFFAAMSGLMLTVSLFCQLGLGFSASRTGLALAPMSVGIVIGAASSFALVARLGRRVIQVGVAGLGAGVALLALAVDAAGAGTTSWTLVPGALLGGVGAGLVIAPLFDVILAGVTDREVGSASGVLNAVQQFANAVGVALVPTLYLAVTADGGTPEHALTVATGLTIALAAVAFALVFGLPRTAREEPAES